MTIIEITLQFVIITFFSGIAVSAVTLLLGSQVFQLRFLPRFWASSIITCALVFPATKIISLIVSWTEIQSHLPIGQPIIVLFPNIFEAAENIGTDTLLSSHFFFGKWLVFVYGLVTFWLLIRLVVGRYNAISATMKARPAQTESGMKYFISEMNESPFVIRIGGFWGPTRIVLPRCLTDHFNEEHIETILHHEAAHALNNDDEFGLLLRILFVFNWINPLMPFLMARWVQSTEYWADAAVMQQRSSSFREAYAKLLLRAYRLTANRVLQYPTASFSINHLRHEKMRINNIMHGPRANFKHAHHRKKLIFLSMLTVILSATSFSSIASKNPNDTAVGALVINGRISSSYGMRKNPWANNELKEHTGVDVAAPLGTPLYSPENAIVIEATNQYDGRSALGKVVILQTQNGVKTLFSHLDTFTVKTGQRIKKGEAFATIGASGRATGPHVHIETFVNGKRVDPATVWPLRVTLK